MRDVEYRNVFDGITGLRRSNPVHPFILSPFLIFLLLVGCSSPTHPVPDWVIRPQERYPLNQYLSAVGEGDTRRAAENSAAAGLARIFESRIQANETLSETTTETRGSQAAFDQLSELRANIRVGSDQDLPNIQFGESFTGSDGRVYAVATLPRAETAEILRQRMASNSADLLLLTRQSDRAPDPLKAYAFRRAAVKKALENDRLLAQLDIITPGVRPALPYDPQTLYSATAAAAQKVSFSVSFNSDAGDALREALTGDRKSVV